MTSRSNRSLGLALLATGVDNVAIDNLTIDTNRDGIDVDACRNVHISGSTVKTPNDVRDVELHGARGEKAAGVPSFVLRDVTDFRVTHSAPIADRQLRRAARERF